MSQMRHARLRELFLAARERPTGERSRFFAAARGSDAELCREVESLLAHDEALGAAAAKIAPAPPPRPTGQCLRPGSVIGGRYRVTSLLGRGGMGEVYRADDLKLDVAVALKILPAEPAWAEERLALLRNEVRLAREITHPNVCRIHDVGELDGLHFISMELVGGEDLETLLGRGPPPRQRAVDVARGLCAGLDAAHAQGILHRDLKPANLMIDERGEVRITDFGILLRADAEGKSSPAKLAGTPAYMAPEQQAGGTEVSVRTDLYALGLVLYELFTGRRAFEANSIAELERLHREAVPTAPSALAADLDPALERVILRCLEKNPRDRPTSAQAVAAALPGRVELAEGTTLKTVLASELADTARLAEKLGDAPAAKLLARYERLTRDLVHEHGGLEIEKTHAFLLLFERPIHAVLFAHAYHEALAGLSHPSVELRARIGIHLGEVVARRNPPAAMTRGAGPFAVTGLARSMAARLMTLAEGGQTLLNRAAFDVARRGAVGETSRAARLVWLAHGRYELVGLAESVELFEVGEEGVSPLRAPAGSEKARRALTEDVVLGWRPAPGQLLPGRAHWRLGKKLGVGGFGEVWLAAHDKTRERRVFKFCYEAARLSGLEREITLFRLLKEELGNRDDIARIFDWNFEEAPFFIESEYTPGGDLEEWAAARGGIGEVALGERLEIVAQVAEALAAAHSVGVLHKDVKPANVLIWRDAAGRSRARLTDFGVGAVIERRRLAAAGITALGITEATRPGSSDTGGTRLYMAPEVLEGKTATIQADVYALGVMLYQLVVGDLGHALASGWRRDVPDELLREDIAAAVDGVPARRLASAGDLGRRLRALDERRAAHEAERRLRKNLRRSRRRRRLATAAAVVLAIFAVTVSLLALGIRREAQRAKLETHRAQELARTALATNLLLVEHKATWGNLVALEIRDPDATPAARAALHKALTLPVELTVMRHDDWVRSASFSADGRRVVTASEDRTARVWSVASGEEIVRLDGHTKLVAAASWSPDGRRVVTASDDRTARVWNAETGAEIVRMNGHTGRVGVASFSADGRCVVTASEDLTARVWNAETGEEIARLSGHAHPVTAASWSADGRRVVTVSEGPTARVWNVETSRAETGEEIARLDGHTAPVTTALFSPGGGRVVTASEDRTARVWNASTGAEIVRLDGHTGPVTTASWNVDGSRIVTASSDRTARVWNVVPGGTETGTEIARLDGHTGGILGAVWSTDDSRIITSSSDKTARIWDSETGAEIARLYGHTADVTTALPSGDGARVLTASGLDGTARIWNVEIGEEILRLDGHTAAVSTAAFSSDGSRVVTASVDATARIWDTAPGRAAPGRAAPGRAAPGRAAPGRAETGAEIARLEGHTEHISFAAWSGDDTRVLTVSVDGTGRIWEVSGRAAPGAELARLDGHTAWILAAAWSADGSRVVTGSHDGTARLWDAETGLETARFDGHTDHVESVALSADGQRVLTASCDHTARLWNVETGKEIVAMDGHADRVRTASFSPDGSRVVTSSADATARIWDAATGAELARMVGHKKDVWVASFSADGTRVLTGSLDNTARVWDAGAEVARMNGHGGAVWTAAFSPDGSRVVTGSEDGTARIWDAETGEETARLVGHTALVFAASWSADGSRVLTGSFDGTARIWAVVDDYSTYLRARIRARTPLCLPVDVRRETLLERPEDAASHAAACEQCVPVFFERLGDMPVSAWQVYVEAWHVYERCLGH